METEEIIKALMESSNASDVVERLFWDEKPFVLKEHPEIVTPIFDALERIFLLERAEIKLSGSGQLGFSLMHGGRFKRKISDLDIAITSEKMFDRYSAATRRVTRSLSEVSGFIPSNLPQRRTPKGVMDLYLKYERVGILRVDLMPDCEERLLFIRALSELAREGAEYFGDISATIYRGKTPFLQAQTERIKRFVARKPVRIKSAEGDAARVEFLFAEPERTRAKQNLSPESLKQVPKNVEVLISALEALPISLECLVTIPTGDPNVSGGAMDVVVFYDDHRIEASELNLKRFAAGYLKNGMVITFFPVSRGIASLVKFVGLHFARVNSELGARAVERAQFIRISDH